MVGLAVRYTTARFGVSNPIHPDVFPGVRKMEAEVVAMTLGMFGAPEDGAGVTTSGGTESILMAYCTHGIQESCSTLQSPRAYNDIPALSRLATKHKLPLHVDCCLGSFVIPMLSRAGFPAPEFDFRVPGVTSISVDTHKYGFAPKGNSVVLYRSKDMRRYQYYVCPDWSGGVYASPGIAGSRPGALIAGCWASLMRMGEDGYLDTCLKIVGARQKMEDAIRESEKLKYSIQVIGKPMVSVVAFRAVETQKHDLKVDIYDVADGMSARGWHLNALQDPAAIHVAVTIPIVAVIDDLIKDLEEVVLSCQGKAVEKKGDTAALYGVAGALPDKSVVLEAGFVGFTLWYAQSTAFMSSLPIRTLLNAKLPRYMSAMYPDVPLSGYRDELLECRWEATDLRTVCKKAGEYSGAGSALSPYYPAATHNSHQEAQISRRMLHQLDRNRPRMRPAQRRIHPVHYRFTIIIHRTVWAGLSRVPARIMPHHPGSGPSRCYSRRSMIASATGISTRMMCKRASYWYASHDMNLDSRLLLSLSIPSGCFRDGAMEARTLSPSPISCPFFLTPFPKPQVLFHLSSSSPQPTIHSL
ncbi:putative sphingosine-1-phosphate lyase [Hortaea werneckii]|nr:putative sphingosine-1-phosphate lyase [Hortaea werneckii]